MKTKLNLTRTLSRTMLMAAMLTSPLLLAAKGEGCSGTAGQDAPDLAGDWDLTWEDNLDVTITIGGAVYEESLGAQGGAITIDHEGTPITFDLDCARAEVVCPSEVWPSSVGLDQRDENFPRNVYVTIPKSECDGELVDADPSTCGAGTNNEDCEQVCEGTITQADKEAFGLLNPAGDKLTVLLGGGIATNGVNCALLSLSIADVDVETTGTGEEGNWEGTRFPTAEVVTGYAGGCLWAGDVNDDGTVEGLVVGASVRIATAFTGDKR